MKTGVINVTQRMINKCIIDANKTVIDWVKSELPISYDNLIAGEKVAYDAIFQDGSLSKLRIYKRQHKRRKRPDCLLSIKGLRQQCLAGDRIELTAPQGMDKSSANFVVMISVYPYIEPLLQIDREVA
jgi:hypothetical protein